MADIETQAKFDRVNKVYTTGRAENGTKADVDAIGDFTVLMHDPKTPHVLREIPVKHATDYKTRKGFVIGKPRVKAETPKPKKKVTKEQLFEAAGGSPKGALKDEPKE